MSAEISPWVWLVLSLALLLPLEQWLHRHLQGLFLLLAGSPEIALVLYSLIFLPGILLHEGSHWLVATLLGVRTGRFSVWPQQQPNGTLRLGYVETEKIDFVREALIGAAPMIMGGLLVSLVGLARLNLGAVGLALGRADLVAAFEAAWASLGTPDAWVWLYLIFTVSNSMLPSASDRRAWPFVALLMVLLGGVLFYAGFGPLLVQSLAEPVERAVRALAAIFTVTVGVDLLLMPVIGLLELGVIRITGLRVEY